MVYDLPVMSGNISRSIEALAANKGFLRTLSQKDDFFQSLVSFNAKEGAIASWVKGQTGATDKLLSI